MAKSIVKAKNILIPAAGTDMEKWAVVACDQFTSQRGYWQSLKDVVSDSVSALNLVVPEVYLEDADVGARIAAAAKAMHTYVEKGVFREITDSFILVLRDTAYFSGRAGLVLPVDLEAFDFKPFTDKPARATEGTVLSRIPPRLEVRKHAALELPHIILLIDDPGKTVIEPLLEKRAEFEKLYDFRLNMNGGHIKGWRITDIARVTDALTALLGAEVQASKYGRDAGFLFAVGDGNHSLVTAKAHWDFLKESLTSEERENHPARYALAEVENLYCDAIKFEPIHRVVFGDTDGFISGLKVACRGAGKLNYFGKDGEGYISVPTDSAEAISQIQAFIEVFAARNPGFKVDYIHGIEHLKEVSGECGGVALVMPTVEKSALFPFVLKHGVLPKKSFSMGEAEEKRYYLEAKRIDI
ncbi:MAG: DUF1015 domain-containing protein [Clostridiaceae bacterium]|jgi:hypothetical protein|nr:DUF1015 domain-containing protein [Clostridiaceae bacterium]